MTSSETETKKKQSCIIEKKWISLKKLTIAKNKVVWKMSNSGTKQNRPECYGVNRYYDEGLGKKF